MQIICGLLSQIIVIRIIGAGESTDSLVAAQSIIAVIVGLIGAALQGIWQSKMSQASQRPDRWRIEMSLSLGQCFLLCLITLGPIVLGSNLIVNLIFSELHPDNNKLASNFIYILAVMSIFGLISSQLLLCLRAIGKFIIPELINLILAIIAIFVLIKSLPTYGIESVIWIALMRSFIFFIIVYVISGKPLFDIKNSLRDRKIWKLLIPMLGANSLSKFSPLIDRYFIAQAGTGMLTIFNLAMITAGAISTILERGVTTPVASNIGKMVLEIKHKDIIKTINAVIHRNSIIIFIFIIIGIVSIDIEEKIIFEILKIDINKIDLMLNIILALSGYIFASAAGPVIVSTIISYELEKKFLFISLIGFIIGVFYKFIGFTIFGAYGLAFGISLYYLTNMLIMYIECKKIKFNSL